MFQNLMGDLLSRLQGEPLDRIILKSVCIWSNYHSANLLWFERNRIN